MKRYFYDTEFIEDGQTIDLISIGVVADDGRSYYAISTEFDPKKASQWVKDNVLSQLPPRNVNFGDPSVAPRIKDEAMAWRPRKQIANDLIAFFRNGPQAEQEKFELWGYYADYDHVALCQLFGTMMDLPKGWPMYTLDLKQWCYQLGDPRLPAQGKGEHNALEDAKWNKNVYTFLSQRA